MFVFLEPILPAAEPYFLPFSIRCSFESPQIPVLFSLFLCPIIGPTFSPPIFPPFFLLFFHFHSIVLSLKRELLFLSSAAPLPPFTWAALGIFLQFSTCHFQTAARMAITTMIAQSESPIKRLIQRGDSTHTQGQVI